MDVSQQWPASGGTVVELVVFQYDDLESADAVAAAVLRRPAGEAADAAEDLELIGLAVVRWPSRATRPNFRPVESAGQEPRVSTAFWGLLFGMVFYLPLVGAALGRTTGTVADLLVDMGIGDTFVNRLRDQVVPGTSSLAVLSASEDLDGLRARADPSGRRTEMVVRLDDRHQAALWAVFGA
jgi:uncharacterized membrane protein